MEARIAIFGIQLKKRPIADDVNVRELARITESYSGADISAICKEAADIPLGEALRGGEPRKIKMQDFLQAIKQRKPSILSWYSSAKDQIMHTGETDAFEDILKRELDAG
jgi:transitional endoplasmic reticulum ATPase